MVIEHSCEIKRQNECRDLCKHWNRLGFRVFTLCQTGTQTEAKEIPESVFGLSQQESPMRCPPEESPMHQLYS